MGSIAHELITHGWHQGDLRGPDGSVCLMGAALASVGGDLELYSPIAAILERLLRGAFVAVWNDNPYRTFDEVLRVAKEADELLDAS